MSRSFWLENATPPRSFWLENATPPSKHIIVDCGPIALAEENYKLLVRFIARSNFERVGFNRLVAHIPKTKLAAVLKAIPSIKEGAQQYCWCTHGFVRARKRGQPSKETPALTRRPH